MDFSLYCRRVGQALSSRLLNLFGTALLLVQSLRLGSITVYVLMTTNNLYSNYAVCVILRKASAAKYLGFAIESMLAKESVSGGTAKQISTMLLESASL